MHSVHAREQTHEIENSLNESNKSQETKLIKLIHTVVHRTEQASEISTALVP